MHLSRPLGVLPALLGALLAAVGLGTAPALAAVEGPGGSGPIAAGQVAASAAAEGPTAERPPIVVVGTAGVRWSDLDPVSTPALWSLAETGAVGSLVTRSVRTASCPADGWLALSAGNRAADAAAPGGCLELVEPGPDGAVPRWNVYLSERDAQSYGSRLGALGALLTEHGLDSAGIGPGAAIALSTPDGELAGTHAPLPDAASELAELVAEGLESSALVVVDAGVVTDPSGEGARSRAAQVAAVEDRVAAVGEALAATSEAAVLLVSLADAGPRPHLQVLVARGVGDATSRQSGEVLRSASTRQDGFVLATDVLPTLLEALGIGGAEPDGAIIGSAARGTAVEALGGTRVPAMVDLDRHAGAIRSLTPGFFAAFIALNLALYAAVWLRMFRGSARLSSFRVAGVVVGVLPVASFLANLVPWWRTEPSAVGLYLATAAAAGLVAALALLGPWRHAPLGPLGVVAGITAATIVLDVVTGSRLQLGSPLGVHPLVAGRFYGLNNSAFALLMVSSLLVASLGASALVARGRRAAAVGLVVAVGVVVTVVDGMPGLGSDFGGPPALVPAFAVLALLVAGVRVGWRRLVLVLGAGLVVVTAFALADWLRPAAEQTHLGRFVQTVLDGGLWDVVWRKLGQNFTILTSSWLVLLVAAGIVLLVWLLGRGRAESADLGGRGALAAAASQLPALRLTIPAAATGLVIGFAVNDSGIVIPAVGMSLALPLVVAALAGSLVQRDAAVLDAELRAPGAASG